MTGLRALTAAAILAALTASFSAPALAVGDEDDPPRCKRGEIYDQTKKACVKAQSGVVDDDSLADYAYALARAERFEEALATLDLMQNGNTAEALNYRGYATRKLGRLDQGIALYKQAVALDPDYTLVREYLGEAYVVKGRLDLAKGQLVEIEKRCGTGCEPYQDLSEAIAGAES
jgi:tetratricopeptide (TPR) repeat protein